MLENFKFTLFSAFDRHIFKKDYDSNCVSPRRTFLKWIALFFCCLTTMGGYYCHDAPVPLQTPMMSIFDISTTHFNLLFTVYSLPNIIMPILGGFVIDKLGVRVGLFLFAALICVGQAFVVLGAYTLSFNLMIAGTGLLGIGLDSLCAAKSTMVVKWFQGQELALSMGLTLTVSRLGSSLSSYLSPWLYAKDLNLATPFNFGLFLGFFSLVMVLILNVLDIYADDREGSLTTHETKAKEEFKISDMKDFRLIFYLIVLNCMITYAVIKGFLNNSGDLMNKRFGFTPQMSGKYLSIVYILATILSPVFGGIVDRIGRRIQMILGSIVIMALVHLYTAFLQDSSKENPNTSIIWALIGVGIAFSAYAAVIWPAISLIVKANANGTAYGFTLAMQNLMLSVIPLIVGFIHDRTLDTSFGYFWTSIFLFFLSLAGIANTIFMKKEDSKTGNVLELPPSDKIKSSYQELPEENADIELSDNIKGKRRSS